MSDQRGAGEGSATHAGTGHYSRRYRQLAMAVLVTGVFLAVLAAMVCHAEWRLQLLWTGPLLAIAFFVAEHLTIDLNVRRVDWTISFTEIPLVIGLLVAPLPVVLGAHLLAGLGTQIRRRAITHLPYNTGVMVTEIAIPFLIFRALQGQWAGTPIWVPAGLAALTSPLVSDVLALIALRTIGSGLRTADALRLSARTLVLGLMNTSVGLVGYEVVISSQWGIALVALFVIALVPLYLAYSALLREHRDLAALAEFSLAVARVGDQEAEMTGEPDTNFPEQWRPLAERIRDQFGASRVVLHLMVDAVTPPTTVVVGRPLPERALSGDARWLTKDPLLHLTGSEVRQFGSTAGTTQEQAALRRRDAREALVAPLRGADQLLGALEVHDRASRWRGFSGPDVRMLRTVAGHLATAVDNRRLVARLRHHAYHDPQTGLLNRAGFVESASGPLREYPHSVLLRVDLDVLSTVSDALGYVWGDRMVVAAGRRLREALGPEVPLARLEGGSFAALLVGCDSDDVSEVAGRLRHELALPYQVDRLTVEASAVIGYVSSTAEGVNEHPDVNTLLQRADVALHVTRGGERPIREYSPAMGQVFLRRFQLVTQFRQAISSGQVHVHYQPKIALASRQVLGAEALVRWQHPEFGRLDPDEFIPAVEAAGLVDVLTDFVIAQALAHVRKWVDRGIHLSASVNLSVRTLGDELFPERVASALARHDLSADSLTLELTESAVMSDPERALPVLNRLHALGVTLAVDDFGTGYSSLAYLRQLPVDEVKIDKSFVLGMATDLGDLAVVKSIVELGHSLGLTVVGEGVEDDAVRDQLLSMDCDVAQGYLISRPLPEDRFAAWIQVRTIPSDPQVCGLTGGTMLTLTP